MIRFSPTPTEPAASAALLSAQSCYVEASFRESDCAALLYAMQRRADKAGWTFERMLVKYTAVDAESERAAAARRYPDADVAGMGDRWNARWRRLREHAAAVLRGEVEDPCPGSSHFNARNLPAEAARARRKREAGEWALVHCRTRVANEFNRVLSASVAKGDR